MVAIATAKNTSFSFRFIAEAYYNLEQICLGLAVPQKKAALAVLQKKVDWVEQSPFGCCPELSTYHWLSGGLPRTFGTGSGYLWFVE